MRRHATIIILLLPLGLALSAAVAIWFGMMVDSSSLRVKASGYSLLDQHGTHGWYVQVQRGLGKRHAISHHVAVPGRYRYEEANPAERIVPRWMDRGPPGTLYEGERLRSIDVACGWPAPMLVGGVELDRFAAITTTRSFRVTATAAGTSAVYGHELRGVPLRPIWWGAAINSIFFSLLLWAAFPGAIEARRRWRAYRNLCVRCTYDLRGGPHARCPECGATIA